MARAQFEYDEVGNTFWYVLVSFYAMVLLPLTYYIWPSLPKRLESRFVGCQCEGDLIKRRRKDAVQPWERRKRLVKAVILLILWALFVYLAYKVTQIEHHFEEYDPYKILGLDQDAGAPEIKKKYRELSKLHHPDKGGDAMMFDNIVKAYKALTDEESRENWRLYGNPDGPKATTFGIALPKWIVSERYGLWVLAFYGLVFMVILPTAVGLWWYNSMKYSADKVLLETTRLYYYFLQKTPSMEINRIIMVLAGSFEFWRKFNTAIVERESDDIEVPRAMKEVRNLSENKREAPFCHPWSLKARTLLHCYLTRVDTLGEPLVDDQTYMVGRILPLLDEYIRVLIQMVLNIPLQRTPTLETLENSLRLFPMFVQALWPRNSSLLQLPHLSEHNIHFLRKNRVITCQDLANLNESKRRSLLNTVSEEQYRDICHVLSMMPRLEIDARVEVEGEDDKETVTIGSVVTVKVILKRSPLFDLSRREEEIRNGSIVANKHFIDKATEEKREGCEGEEDEEEEEQAMAGAPNKRKVWEKRPKKKIKKGGKGGGKPPGGKKAPPPTKQAPASPSTDQQQSDNLSPKSTPKEKDRKKKEKKRERQEGDGEEQNASDASNSADDESHSDDGGSVSGDDELDDYTASKQEGLEASDEEDDDEMWGEEAEGLVRKETLLDREPTNHHEVHCPYYPPDKYEWWYLYLVERKHRRLISAVVPCKTLDQEKTVELKFSAPPQKGTYFLTVNVKSDSYMDCDWAQDIKIEVHPAREPIQVKYEDTEEEEGDKDKSGSSDGVYTEGSDSEQGE